MAEVALPRLVLAVAILSIAAIVIGGIYFYYVKQTQKITTQFVVENVGGSLEESVGSGESQGQPIKFQGGSVGVIYEDHVLDIYYNVSQEAIELPGIGPVTPSIYSPTVEYPVLAVTPGGDIETYKENGSILAVASEEEGLLAVDPLVLAYSDGTTVYLAPRLLLLYSVDPTEMVANITIVVPKINVTCQGGTCSNLNGYYQVDVKASIVDVLPAPYSPVNIVASGRYIEALFEYDPGSVLPQDYFGKVDVVVVDYDYTINIFIKYLYYNITLTRVG